MRWGHQPYMLLKYTGEVLTSLIMDLNQTDQWNKETDTNTMQQLIKVTVQLMGGKLSNK